MAIDWNINPLVFLEFAVVLAFGIGWLVLERFTKRYDRKDDESKSDPASRRDVGD